MRVTIVEWDDGKAAVAGVNQVTKGHRRSRFPHGLEHVEDLFQQRCLQPILLEFGDDRAFVGEPE